MFQGKILIVLFLLLALPLAGCVSKNTYQQKVNEADLLSRDKVKLEADKAELNAERNGLEKELSDINQRLIATLNEKSDLQKKLISTRAEINRQTQSFSYQQSEMDTQIADMQKTNEQLLFSIDQLQAEKLKLEQQLEREKIAREARLAKLKNTYDQLVGALESEIKRGELTITNLEGKLSVNLLNQILFDSGKTVIKPEGRKVLQSLGDVLNKFPDRALQVEGHTDNVQISSRLAETYPTNWELSTARATSVVHFLQDTVGLPGDRLVAAGFSEYRPVAGNEEAEGRAQNRRIQINLIAYEPPVFQEKKDSNE